MRVAVVYESLFGNTRQVAEAITIGIQEADPTAETACLRTGDGDDADEASGADLLVLGAPTHFFGLPSRRSRQLWLRPDDVAARRTRSGHLLEPDALSEGMRGWLDRLPANPGALAAVFDTRLDRPLAGGAAKRIARQLRRRGYHLVSDPEAFIVRDMEGPLGGGEKLHAKAWGAALVTRVGKAVVQASA